MAAWGKAFGASFGASWGRLSQQPPFPEPEAPSTRTGGRLIGVAFTQPRPKLPRPRARRHSDILLLKP